MCPTEYTAGLPAVSHRPVRLPRPFPQPGGSTRTRHRDRTQTWARPVHPERAGENTKTEERLAHWRSVRARISLLTFPRNPSPGDICSQPTPGPTECQPSYSNVLKNFRI